MRLGREQLVSTVDTNSSATLCSQKLQSKPRKQVQLNDEPTYIPPMNSIIFRKRHLWRTSEALLLPHELQLDNGMWTSNEEMLIVLLLRFATTDGWLKLESMIQVELSRLSRVFKVIILLLN
jgi:hypothetical protein